MLVLLHPDDGGLAYQAASSLGPGPILLGDRKLPLTPDAVFEISISGTAAAVFGNYSGVLDARGSAQATINIPRVNSLIGLNFHSAFVTLKATAPFGLQSISNNVAVTIR